MVDADDFVAGALAQPELLRRIGEFRRLAELTGLRRSAQGGYYLSNLHRGLLLYALVRKHRPRTILEIGTGRGYGALSMAMAVADTGLDSRILSVDMIPPGERQSWPIDEGSGPTTARLSVREVWSRLPAAWTDAIHTMTGSSVAVMRRMLSDPAAPPVDFAFIDGGHDYWTARHDVLAALLAGRGRSVTLVLDDYGGVQGEDVRRLVDGILATVYPSATIHRLAMPQSEEEARDNGEHGMVYLDGDAAPITSAPLLARWPAGLMLRAWGLAATGLRHVRRWRYRVGSAAAKWPGRAK
jgi:methyltransferase family protein